MISSYVKILNYIQAIGLSSANSNTPSHYLGLLRHKYRLIDVAPFRLNL